MNPLTDILSLLLPRTCPACRKPLKDWEECLCLVCLAQLPVTHFHRDPDNPLAEIFWGRVKLLQAVAWFYFRKGSVYQDALHKLKYNNRPDIGFSLGKQFGYELYQSNKFIKPDILIPVPLNPKKLRKRGYNQSDAIGKGLSTSLKIPLINNVLTRPVATSTQTRKSRYERYLNVTGKFKIRNPALLENRHVLLIDDVITTGATLEACAEELLAIPGVSVSVAALAWAKNE
ncbi:MAG: ComF family protein [Porphyromonadaceae bacterium]|nr:MAG: ComF family protein [Porphyromonadaceae bacterium]